MRLYTAAYVREIAEREGLIPIQVDGIPEGFSYITPSLTIGDHTYGDQYVAFVPMTEYRAHAVTLPGILNNYNNEFRKTIYVKNY